MMKRTTSKGQTAHFKRNILACDPSFTAWGWAVVSERNVVDFGVISTKPQAKKMKIREGDDRIRRIGEIYSELKDIIAKHRVYYIVAELPHGSQNAKAAIMMGSVAAILSGFDQLRGVPVEWYSENDAKKALLGRISASKGEVVQAVAERFDWPQTGTQYIDEAVSDALAIYNVALQQSPTVKFLNQDGSNK